MYNNKTAKTTTITGKVKTCKHRRCENKVSGRKSYCSTTCKYWENVMHKEEEKHLPPKKYRNDKYFPMVVGSSLGGKGQGKRSNGMIMGGMSSVAVASEVYAKVNDVNLKKHFSFNGIHIAFLCGGGRITRKEYESINFSIVS